MTHEIESWDAEEWLQKNKDIWNHPMVTDRTDSNAYEVADLMADFANYILSKQKQKTKDMKEQTAIDWLIEQLYDHQGHIDILDVARINGYFEEAKKMEKQQHENTWYAGDEDGAIHEFEYYWKETYGGAK